MTSLFNLVPVTEIRFINLKSKISVKRRNLIHAVNPAIAIKLNNNYKIKISTTLY